MSCIIMLIIICRSGIHWTGPRAGLDHKVIIPICMVSSANKDSSYPDLLAIVCVCVCVLFF